MEDSCFRNPPCKVTRPGNQADDFTVTCQMGILMWTEHRRYCQTQRGSVTEHRAFAHSVLHRSQLHPSQLFMPLQHSLFHSTPAQSRDKRIRVKPSFVSLWHTACSYRAQEALPFPLPPGSCSHSCTFRHSNKKVSGRESRVKIVSSEEIKVQLKIFKATG